MMWCVEGEAFRGFGGSEVLGEMMAVILEWGEEW